MRFLQNLSTSLTFYQNAKNLEICKHLSNPFKMYSIISNFIKFCQHLSNDPSISKSITISSDAPSISKSLKIYKILWTDFKIFQILSTSFKFLLNPLNYTNIYTHLPNYARFHKILSKSIMFQHLSTSSELSRNLYFFFTNLSNSIKINEMLATSQNLSLFPAHHNLKTLRNL